MDHWHRLDVRMSYAAENSLDFGSQQVSCPPSARSFSTSSSSDPYTPTSGRSTPHQAPGSMANFDPVICSSSSMAYEMTPPTSDLESYFPIEVKSEFPPALSNCNTMLRMPVERYEPGMNMALNQMTDSMFHGMYSDSPSSQQLHAYSFPVQNMRHQPSSNVSTGSYMLPSSEFDAFQAWNGESEPFHGDFYQRPSTSMVPVDQLDVSMPSKSPRSIGSLASNGRKRRLKEVQKKTRDLRRVQSPHYEAPEAYDDEDWDRVRFEGKAQHFCQWYGCNKSFRRLEHLKRHLETVHLKKTLIECEFCPPQKGPKIFNRIDNYRSHIELHTKRPSNSAKRTNYHPAAQAHLEILEAEKKVRAKKPKAPTSSTSKKSSPTPSSSVGGACGVGGSGEEASSLAAARQAMTRLDLKTTASPAA